ncbi:hypothetical protein BC941DRAFT_470151 [Chlamydoabsidia padenii]|nr:hypothetical protein BC941DRAFT_470151 [Chlamydoabsidia padenii]
MLTVVITKENGLELLILEASGALKTRNKNRHVFDHIESAFGCHAMIRAILQKYPYGHHNLLEGISVTFVHSSAKDDFLQLWVMRPRCGGAILSLECVAKVMIPLDQQDMIGVKNVNDFFWLVTLERSLNAVNALACIGLT